MPSFSEKRVLPYAPDQLFDLVAAVDRYPEFLPWCIASRIRTRESFADAEGHKRERMEADLVIGFKMIRERFTSKVELLRPHEVLVTDVTGPFEHLRNRWCFEPHPEGCLVDFEVDFKFRSRLLDNVMGALFGEATRRMVKAFEARAADLYGREHLHRGQAPRPAEP
ncbi:type II toxin-antitoxin system RatA family toxin [Tistrella mobilis]|jgi:coenzyme Q-binding protein COQ10|uniref:type II toxin-antitoxin system RatA family toxin n=1 Tax=Tistrella mobilis TaxID=171437 RepID=UPI0035565B1A